MATGWIGAAITLFLSALAVVWLGSVIADKVGGKTPMQKFAIGATLGSLLIGAVLGTISLGFNFAVVGIAVAMAIYYGLIFLVYGIVGEKLVNLPTP